MYQKILLIGNLGKEPDLKVTPAGTSVCHTSMATNRVYNNNGKEVKETCWFNLTIWGKMGEAVGQYMHKGSKVFVEGRLTPGDGGNPRIWNDSNGNPHASYDVTALEFKFLDSKGQEVPVEDANSDNVPSYNSEPIPF